MIQTYKCMERDGTASIDKYHLECLGDWVEICKFIFQQHFSEVVNSHIRLVVHQHPRLLLGAGNTPGKTTTARNLNLGAVQAALSAVNI